MALTTDEQKTLRKMGIDPKYATLDDTTDLRDLKLEESGGKVPTVTPSVTEARAARANFEREFEATLHGRPHQHVDPMLGNTSQERKDIARGATEQEAQAIHARGADWNYEAAKLALGSLRMRTKAGPAVSLAAKEADAAYEVTLGVGPGGQMRALEDGSNAGSLGVAAEQARKVANEAGLAAARIKDVMAKLEGELCTLRKRWLAAGEAEIHADGRARDLENESRQARWNGQPKVFP